MEGGKDQVSWPVDPVPGMSQKGTADVSPGHHLLSCGARFEPTTFKRHQHLLPVHGGPARDEEEAGGDAGEDQGLEGHSQHAREGADALQYV